MQSSFTQLFPTGSGTNSNTLLITMQLSALKVKVNGRCITESERSEPASLGESSEVVLYYVWL